MAWSPHARLILPIRNHGAHPRGRTGAELRGEECSDIEILIVLKSLQQHLDPFSQKRYIGTGATLGDR
jgi:hypothetical protein